MFGVVLVLAVYRKAAHEALAALEDRDPDQRLLARRGILIDEGIEIEALERTRMDRRKREIQGKRA
jgi:hypothetical protein